MLTKLGRLYVAIEASRHFITTDTNVAAVANSWHSASLSQLSMYTFVCNQLQQLATCCCCTTSHDGWHCRCVSLMHLPHYNLSPFGADQDLVINALLVHLLTRKVKSFPLTAKRATLISISVAISQILQNHSCRASTSHGVSRHKTTAAGLAHHMACLVTPQLFGSHQIILLGDRGTRV